MASAESIRTLFLSPKATYTIAEASAMLGMSVHEVRGWMAVGELEGCRGAEGDVIPWQELVSFGMDFWSQEAVEQALGARLAEAIPELLRLDDLHVRVPRLDILTLEQLARRDAHSVSTVLSHQLRDLTSAHSEWLAEQIPGFAEALAWPAATSGNSAS